MMAQQQFRDAIASAGLTPPEVVEADGKLRRFPANGKRGDDSGWYVLHHDGVPAGAFGDWRSGVSETWRANLGRTLTPAEESAHRAKVEAMRRQRDAEEAQRASDAAAEAARIWREAAPAGAHPYLERKGIKCHGAKLNGGRLVIPMRLEGWLCSLQYIAADGEKRFHPGGKVSGAYFSIGKPESGPVLICEGFATGASLNEATGHAVAVAFNAGNLEPVAKALRTKFPNGKLILCADDDAGTDGNPGMTKAKEAAHAVGGLLAVPDFGTDRKQKQTDFNDLMQANGVEAVKRTVEAARSVEQEAKPGLIIYRRISEIEAKPIRWLWPGRIARGKVSMIAGHPGLGKSQITASLAAIVTKGGRWPVDRTGCERGNVLFLSAEDDPADTIRPRLEAAGADLERVSIIQAVRDGFNSEGHELQRAFNLKEDIRRLESVLQEIGDVALVIIDPVSAYLGNTESHNNAEVRALLAPLSDMAGRAGAAVVAVSHLNKGNGSGADALSRVTGSLAFVAAARAAYIVAKDSEDEARRVFMPAKNNIGADIGGLAFRIEGCTIGAGIETSRIVWEADAVTGISADELLRVPTDPEERSALDDARAWLRSMLADGPLPAKQIFREANEAGHAEKTVRRAQRAIGIDPRKDGKTGPWLWALPAEDGQKAEDGQPQRHGHLQESWPSSGQEQPEVEKF